ncbi:hypothetical protein VTJ49DRAFT_2947 [Mycothermus thermophilus]|uniref:F-box domain-containing protein n=1 Tax=Humicola insolens TaxID=85995 RepID=A0ABR3V8V5_HUMIN
MAGSVPHIPSEILIMILEHLPGSFFQQDIGRLTISRRWFNLAIPIFYSRIDFTPRVISRLVHVKSASVDKARARLRKSLRCANIVLNGISTTHGNGRRGGSSIIDLSRTLITTSQVTDTACWNTPNNLIRLAVLLGGFLSLTSIRFVAGWSNPFWFADPLQPGYLGISSLDPYLNPLPNVTSLDLDLHGTSVIDDKGEPVHFCSYIRPLLSRLRTLRLRARSLCLVAFAPPDSDSPWSEPPPVTVSHLTVNLYLGRASEYNPKLNVVRQCFDWPRWQMLSVQDARRAMRGLVRRMPEPKRAELVHLAPNGEVHMLDLSTDVCVRDWSEGVGEVPGWSGVDPAQPCFHDEEASFVDWSGEVPMLPTAEEWEEGLGGGFL